MSNEYTKDKATYRGYFLSVFVRFIREALSDEYTMDEIRELFETALFTATAPKDE